MDPSLEPPDAGASPSPAQNLGRWQPWTRSPEPGRAKGLAGALGALCANRDAGLERVAKRLSGTGTEDVGLAPSELGFELRVAGSPHVWPRSWSYAGPKLDPEDALARAGRWLAGFGDGGVRTCGAHHSSAPGHEQVTLVAVDALAHLEKLPASARPGQWLDVTARSLVPVTGAKVVLLGPRGRPRTVPTSVEDGVIRARFAPSSPGTWLVQVVADVKQGPRPVLEALVHAGTRPPVLFDSSPAPGESAARADDEPEVALLAMLNAARASEGASSLERHADLDRAARVHAEAMRDAKSLGHDVGKGTVRQRLEALGLDPPAFGENVARAGSVARAHRAIWASPSHRGNLLEEGYDSVGVAAVPGPEGVWVTEVFARLK
jgi:uncharacterized protein YkwD